jgi:hypothetical protein
VYTNLQTSKVRVGLLRLELKENDEDRQRLKAASEVAEHRLYVSLEGNWSSVDRSIIQQRLHFIYDELSTNSPHLDARVMLPAPGNRRGRNNGLFYLFFSLM